MEIRLTTYFFLQKKGGILMRERARALHSYYRAA